MLVSCPHTLGLPVLQPLTGNQRWHLHPHWPRTSSLCSQNQLQIRRNENSRRTIPQICPKPIFPWILFTHWESAQPYQHLGTKKSKNCTNIFFIEKHTICRFCHWKGKKIGSQGQIQNCSTQCSCGMCCTQGQIQDLLHPGADPGFVTPRGRSIVVCTQGQIQGLLHPWGRS